MVDLATRPVQAGRPQTLVEAAQTFVERPILLGTRFEIPGTGDGLRKQLGILRAVRVS